MRKFGLVLVGSSVLLGAGAGVFALLSARDAGRVQNGGLATGQQILEAQQSAANRASVARILGIAAISALAAGGALWFFNASSGQPELAVAARF